MGRVCIVRDLMAELVLGRVCHGPSLLWAEMSRNRISLINNAYNLLLLF